jgi:aminoglycoside 2''-phosphotransferase
MLHPPASDRDLTPRIVQAVLREQFPELGHESVVHLGSGWEYDAYLVDEAVVLRFPRYAEVAAGLDRVESILKLVVESVAADLTVPRIILRGEPGAHFPHRFFGHRIIPGVPAISERAPECANLASDLGRALGALHSIPPATAEALGAARQKWTCRSAFDGLVALVAEAEGIQDLAPAAVEWLRAGPTVPAEYRGPPRVLHDDLSPDHIIVDASSGRLRGVIDWGLALGDPAQDLTFILPWWGWEFTTRLLESYGQPLDEPFVQRLDFLARVRSLGSLGHSIPDPLGVRNSLRMIGNAFPGSGSS